MSRGKYSVQSHGHRRSSAASKTLTYKSWENMRKRCGAGAYRDISVCDRWQSFDAFLEDMGERPSAAHSIDRIDPRGDYGPGNCRWATQRQQARNKKSTKMLTHPDTGETMCASDWANRLGVSKSTIARRIRLWPLRRALTGRSVWWMGEPPAQKLDNSRS